LIASRTRLAFPVPYREIGLTSGVVDALIAHFRLTAKGESGLDKRTDFRTAPVDGATTSIEYGNYTIGRVANDRVSEVKDLFLNLLAEVITREEHSEMSRLFIVLAQLKRKLHDELLVVILRRVVPGRCRYCPI